MARRARSDSTSTALKGFADSRRQIHWPSTVTHLQDPAEAKRAAEIFAGIISARAIDDWRPHDVVLAAQLSNVTSQADALSQLIQEQGWVTPSLKNPQALVRNPLLDALTFVSSRQLSLTRALALSGAPTDRRTSDRNARGAEKARALSQRTAGGLLAGDSDLPPRGVRQ